MPLAILKRKHCGTPSVLLGCILNGGWLGAFRLGFQFMLPPRYYRCIFGLIHLGKHELPLQLERWRDGCATFSLYWGRILKSEYLPYYYFRGVPIYLIRAVSARTFARGARPPSSFMSHNRACPIQQTQWRLLPVSSGLRT